jgi:hypothetical protein
VNIPTAPVDTILKVVALAVLWLAGTAGAAAQEQIPQEELEGLLKVKIRTVQHLALNPVLVRATRQQNRVGLTMDEIKRRDDAWRGSKELTPFKRSQQESRAGKLLKRFVDRSISFNEAFLTDVQGANVAAYPATSDYWQGDEDKWIESYRGGDSRIFIGPLELDDSTQTYAVQISAPVLDRDRSIGILVVGVTISYLEARRR